MFLGALVSVNFPRQAFLVRWLSPGRPPQPFLVPCCRVVSPGRPRVKGRFIKTAGIVRANKKKKKKRQLCIAGSALPTTQPAGSLATLQLQNSQAQAQAQGLAQAQAQGLAQAQAQAQGLAQAQAQGLGLAQVQVQALVAGAAK